MGVVVEVWVGNVGVVVAMELVMEIVRWGLLWVVVVVVVWVGMVVV